ncbi:hypothetical protein M0208_14340 [Sphingomonas sp. SUN019]|nr:hypothetical protein [Sphingomonas sp. SUN019]UVO51626.1 hypothetical protein M0208_14340 [Sphingomonas sp. SUN019]
MGDNKERGIEKAVEELLTDPDAPEKGNTTPPQTIDAEPAADRAPGSDKS